MTETIPLNNGEALTSSDTELTEKCDGSCRPLKNYMMSAPDLRQKQSVLFFSDLTKKLISSLKQNEARYRLEFFQKEPTIYSHRVFIRAAKLYGVLKHDPDSSQVQKLRKDRGSKSIPPPVADEEFESVEEKKLTYELAFKTLKYQTILDEIIDEVSFFSFYPELKDDPALVMVMLCDFQNRKFQIRTPLENEVLEENCRDIERAIITLKTKLDACLARHRIKASAPCIEHLLPESVRGQEEKHYKMPVYMWVNMLKSNMYDVISILKEESFEEVTDPKADLNVNQFRLDNHCNDLIEFPTECSPLLRKHHLIETGKAVLQDKSSCLAPHSAKHLLNDDDDIIHVNIGAGLTTAHLASLLHHTESHIWAFSSNTAAEDYRIVQNLEKLGAKKVKLMSTNFLDVDPDDSRFKGVRAVLVTANCSKSAVSNPVEFVINEGEDMNILKDLSATSTDRSWLTELVTSHSALLRHALKIHRSQAVVYYTRSVYEEENENVVQKAVEFINMVQQKRIPYRLVPPVLPFNADEIESRDGIVGKYMKFSPSSKMNGCFVAVITREPQDAKEAAREIIARAHSKGLVLKSEKKEALSKKRISKDFTEPSTQYPSTLIPEKKEEGSPQLKHTTKNPKPTTSNSDQLQIAKRDGFKAVKHATPFK